VLGDDGTCSLNVGDSYSAGGGGATDLAASALAVLGARIGLSRIAERVYAAVAVLAAGGWVASRPVARVRLDRGRPSPTWPHGYR
jgi:hypothetical protein